jgi:hypothetical protein
LDVTEKEKDILTWPHRATIILKGKKKVNKKGGKSHHVACIDHWNVRGQKICSSSTAGIGTEHSETEQGGIRFPPTPRSHEKPVIKRINDERLLFEVISWKVHISY